MMLKDAFDDAVIVLRMLKRLGKAAHAANLVLDNFKNINEPAALLTQRLGELEKYRESVILPRGADLMNPQLYPALGEIIYSYKTLLADRPPDKP